MIGTVFLHKDAVRVSHECVAVIAHGNADHGEGEWVVGRKKQHLCNIYDLPSCKAHEDLRQAMAEKGLLKGVRGTPTHIIYNPHDLSELARTHHMTLGKIEDAIAEAQRTLGKPVTWREYSKAREDLEEAKAHFEEQDYRKAMKSLKGFDSRGLEGLEAEAEKLRADLLAAGEAKIEEARRLIESGENKAAIKILREVSRDFSGTDLAKTAKELIAEAKE
jgi:hypothetical protein